MCTLIYEYTYLYDCFRDVPCLFFCIDDSTAQKKNKQGRNLPCFPIYDFFAPRASSKLAICSGVTEKSSLLIIIINCS